jgi:Protoglobin
MARLDLNMNMPSISGYTRGTPLVAASPMSDADFDLLKQTVLLGVDDIGHLRLAGEVLDDQVEAVLDVWYGFVGSHPHLVKYFNGADGQPNAEYLGAVRRRFGQWIRDTCAANYDRQWLDYQYEIGLRHTRLKKNRTDGVRSTSEVIHLRYLVAFIVPLTATMKPFLAMKGHSAEEVEKMHQAWFKALTLTTALWSQAFVPAQDF